MPIPEPVLLGGSIIGFAAAAFTTFVAVSYLELQEKIKNQVAMGEEPYELKVERRKKPKQKKSKSSRQK
jgi:hypothetical protein